MSSIKVLIFLLGTMVIFMKFQNTSAASLFDGLDDDDIKMLAEDTDDLDEFDASMFKHDDVKDDAQEKRACANYFSANFCERARSWCHSSSHRGRLTARKCRSTCQEC
ncbi:uncharacterized protein LOC110068699 [Orbicella faveolata]|uniref:uncharacterized protein LOC110068699 n=1 Tax=Orbicella faveolata TaxID=48498 RepID=UPI0009E537E3|nr:uncharacterized protein LOC110068699 [Orbicella faveolata]